MQYCLSTNGKRHLSRLSQHKTTKQAQHDSEAFARTRGFINWSLFTLSTPGNS
jgi:hypothetical protein